MSFCVNGVSQPTHSPSESLQSLWTVKKCVEYQVFGNDKNSSQLQSRHKQIGCDECLVLFSQEYFIFLSLNIIISNFTRVYSSERSSETAAQVGSS
jgi:hypothetical protein